MDVVSAVADAGGVPAAQFLAQAAFVSGNCVAAKDFDMNRQGFALGHYSAVGVSGDNINFDACLVDLAQQLLDAFQHLAVLCDCSIEIKDQIFDFKLAPAGDLCFHHKNAPLFLYILSIMLSHNQYSIF